ncbi:peptidase [Oleiphilus sp. HI0009]|nr:MULTISPECIES: imelysin family protein [unclassified Oleiphilus]KZX81669.1 peptidase [Oleiphilus sp. HI0009]KZY65940.1 peptidase [Oleiphilus sp. HI0066]KZY69579.1 peptidase [Oleiphilus sp. HI0067]
MEHTKLVSAAIISGALLTACSTVDEAPAQKTATATDVVSQYVSIAQSNYGDSLNTAKTLDTAIKALLDAPSEESLAAAKSAWIEARVPYQQTEAYRFGNAYVDDWEGKVNAWPLDEGLIDYVDASYGTESDENPYYAANIIANPKLNVGGVEVDASSITPALLSEQLQEIDEVESNVATGYHAIEFLLWGQDLNGTNQGAGARPATDFSLENCTNGNCDRRREYLQAASTLLISDLEDIVAAWTADGEATKQLLAKGDNGGLSTMLTGMGSLSYGELAGERIKLGLMLHDPEEEHDCFADNTHASHFNDALGIRNIYLGSYTKVSGEVVDGASLSDLVAAKDAELDQEMRNKLDVTMSAMQVMVDEANKGNTFDVLIGEGNAEGNKVIQDVVDALVDQTKTIEKIVVALNLEEIEVEGSDSLDNPSAVL